MEALSTSETSVGFCRATRCYIPDDSRLNATLYWNLKSHPVQKLPLFYSKNRCLLQCSFPFMTELILSTHRVMLFCIKECLHQQPTQYLIIPQHICLCRSYSVDLIGCGNSVCFITFPGPLFFTARSDIPGIITVNITNTVTTGALSLLLVTSRTNERIKIRREL